MKKFLVLALGLATLLSGCVAAGGGGAALDFSGRPQPAENPVAGKNHVYNLPHQVPSDYVYRTERIFPPPPGQGGGETAAGALAAVVAEPGARTPPSPPPAGLVERIRGLGTDLAAASRLDDDQSVTVSTFVNLNNLYATSGFGRLLGEEMITVFRNAGLQVIDVRKTPSILIRENGGEYGLSRDMEELSYVHGAHAMLVGTYRQAAGQVFVNARLLRNSDGMVLSAAGMVLDADGLVRELLADEKVPLSRRPQTLKVSSGGRPNPQPGP
ncbi:MAG: FlgO family outer membrane protein [Thermodesulfobacteriota bacterium]